MKPARWILILMLVAALGPLAFKWWIFVPPKCALAIERVIDPTDCSRGPIVEGRLDDGSRLRS